MSLDSIFPQYPVGYKASLLAKTARWTWVISPEPFPGEVILSTANGRTHMHLVRYHVGSTGRTWR